MFTNTISIYVNNEPLYTFAYPEGNCRGDDGQTRK